MENGNNGVVHRILLTNTNGSFWSTGFCSVMPIHEERYSSNEHEWFIFEYDGVRGDDMI